MTTLEIVLNSFDEFFPEDRYWENAEIRPFIISTYNEGYAEGVKDGEGTKNGVQRFQMGYADGYKAGVKDGKDGKDETNMKSP